MNNREKDIILSNFQNAFMVNELLKIDKQEVLREFRHLLSMLNLKKEMVEQENIVICERDNIKGTKKEMYQLIFEIFSKYGIYPHYNITEIDQYYDNLQYNMTEEENKCHKVRINYIKEA